MFPHLAKGRKYPPLRRGGLRAGSRMIRALLSPRRGQRDKLIVREHAAPERGSDNPAFVRRGSPDPAVRPTGGLLIPGFRPHRGQRDKLIEPAIADHRVVVEQNQLLAARRLQALVDRPREPDVLDVADDRDRHAGSIANAGQIGGRVVGRAVVDDDQLPGRPGAPEQRRDAKLGELSLVPAGKDDRAQCGGLFWIQHGGSLHERIRINVCVATHQLNEVPSAFPP